MLMFNVRAPMINMDPRHVYMCERMVINGGKMNVPTPTPLTASPVARFLYLSKYRATHVMAGINAMPNPMPEKKEENQVT